MTGWRVVALTFVATALAIASTAHAQSGLSTPKLKVLFVDAEHPTTWPKGVEPLAVDELRRLLAPQDGPDTQGNAIQIEQAVYRSDFRDGTLRDCRATFKLGTGRRPALISLGRPNLSFSHLRWTDSKDGEHTGDIPYGIDSTGRRLAIANRSGTQIECDWAIAGRSFASATEFNLALPPAVISQIELRVPQALSIDCDQGIISKVTRTFTDGTTLWQIDLGSRNSCRLRIVAASAGKDRQAFYDRDTVILLGTDRLRLQSKLQLDVFGAPTRTLKLAAPTGLRVETISYGDDFPLPFSITPTAQRQEITVELPEPLLGKGRTISVEASAPTRTNQLWTLPQVEFVAATRREDQTQLTIRVPLKLVRFGGEAGLSQSEAPTYSIDGEETFFLRQVGNRDAPVSVEVGEPAPVLSAKMLSRLELRREQCKLTADILCSASGGSTFTIVFDLPDAWEVTRVEAANDVSRMIDETTRTADARRKRTKIDFFRAVTDREPKRFRVEAHRSLPKPGETIDIPVFGFPTFASQEVQTVVVHSSPVELELNPLAAFMPFDTAAIPSGLTDSPLRLDEKGATTSKVLMHHWSAPHAAAHVTLRRSEEGFSAHTRSIVEVGPSQTTEQIDAAITPAAPLDRVLVYLSSEGPPFTWRLTNDPKRALDAMRLPVARRAEFNLPESGELWEVRLGGLRGSPFQLQGSRHVNAHASAKVSLAFFPGAQKFSGEVEIRSPDAGQFEVDARGPRPAPTAAVAKSDRSPAASTAVPQTSRTHPSRTWSYDRPTDALLVRPRASSTSKAGSQLASLELTSHVEANGADDRHVAEFTVVPHSVTRPFRFSLDPIARLCSVTVNGHPVRVQNHAGEIVVPALPADAPNRVAVTYVTSSQSRLFRENRPVVVPRAQAEILSFRWRLHLAPSLKPARAPSGMQFDEPLPALSWAERLFGPIGQSASRIGLSLDPDSWLSEVQSTDGDSESSFGQDWRRSAAAWTSWHASADAVPPNLGLTLWHAREWRVLAWIIGLGCMVAGLAVIRTLPRIGQNLATLAVAATVALSLALPTPYGLVTGAAAVGVLLALIFSRTWKSAPVQSRPTSGNSTSPGSTVSFELHALGVLLPLATFASLALVSTLATFAQDTPPLARPTRDAKTAAAPIESLRTDPASEPEVLVVVPVHAGAARRDRFALPTGKDQLVYLSSAAIERLRQRAAGAARDEGALLLSSDYTILFEERQPTTIRASYRVAVMPGDARFVRLPLVNVTLAGASACRVDGKPFPIRKDDSGFVLTFDSDQHSDSQMPVKSESPQPREPVRAGRPHQSPSPVDMTKSSDEITAIDRIMQPRIYEVQLTFFPNGELAAKPGEFELRVPETPQTLVRVQGGLPRQPIVVEQSDGNTTTVMSGAPPKNLSPTNRLRIATFRRAANATGTPIAAHAVQFVRVTPDLIEMDCRVTYDRAERSQDKFIWLVPAGAAVRSGSDMIRAALRSPSEDLGTRHESENRPATRPETARPADSIMSGLVPLQFDCSGAPDGPVTLTATLLLPIYTAGSTFDLPLPRFTGNDADLAGITLASSQVGISTVIGYRILTTTNEPNLFHTPKADPTFRQESFGARKEPELIFDAQHIASLALQLVPVLPAHKVRAMTHEARVGADRIQWKTTAEIRTENAPAFVHVLHVDRRLKIDSASVREDGVERLVRFSRSGDELTLFLRDRAAATQDLVLTGSLPLDANSATELPVVRLKNGTVSDVRLTISADPDVEVTVLKTFGLVPLSPSESPTGPQNRGSTPQGDVQMIAPQGLREYSLSVEGPMPKIRVTRRAGTVHAVAAPGSAAQTSLNPTATKTSSVESVNSAKTSTGPLPNGSQSARLPSSTLPEKNSPQVLDVKPHLDIAMRLALRSDGSVAGAMHVLLPAGADPVLRLSWPSSATLRAALLDGRAIHPVQTDGQMSIPIPFEAGVHRVALHWDSHAEAALSKFAKIRQELPAPLGGADDGILLCVSTPPNYRIWAPAGLSPVDAPTFHRLCSAIEGTQPSATDDENADTNSSEAHQTKPGDSRRVDAPQPSYLCGRLAVEPSAAVFSAWIIDTRWLRIPLAVAIFALLGAMAFHRYASFAGRWLSAHPQLALATAAVIWWICLSPRLVGGVLLLASLVWVIADARLRRQHRRSRALPSTYHAPLSIDAP